LTENLKHAHGQYSDTVVARCSQLVGSLGNSIEGVYQAEVVSKVTYKAKSRRQDTTAGVQRFVAEYINDSLFSHIPGRQHSAFSGFENVIVIDKSEKLRSRLHKYSNRIPRGICR
jgi:hypothetical protein